MSGTYNATIRRVVISAWIGNSIEYYDFLLYGAGQRAGIWSSFFPWCQPVYRNIIFFCQFWRGIYFPATGRTIFWQQGRYAWA